MGEKGLDTLSPTTIGISGRPPKVRAELRVGDVIDRYVLVEQLGGGGMGIVWAAHDPELDRKVAIKFVRALGARNAQERLHREARAMAKLSHPAVVPVFDVGTTDGQLYIVMELVEGTTLAHSLATRSHTWREVLATFVPCGHALAAAHAAGIIHRDFKPENVLVGRDGRVRVTDFGLARLGTSSAELTEPLPAGPPAASLTCSGAVMGTPLYMAPEQLDGEDVTERSDQFSFGVALWRALYRASPFGTDSIDASSSYVALKAAITSGRLVEPPRSLGVPARLHRVLGRALAVEPDARWPSMSELVDALEDVPQRRRRIMIAAAALAATGASVALGYAIIPSRREEAAGCPRAERLATVWDANIVSLGRRAFEASALPFAAPTWTLVATRLDAYANDWVARATASCRATARGEQQADTALLRERCLDDRLEALAALTTQLARADRSAIERAAEAVDHLPELGVCDDVAALQELPLPPSDLVQRNRARELGERLAAIEAERTLGSFATALQHAEPAVRDAHAIGYLPSEAAALGLLGRIEAELAHPSAATNLARAAELADAARDDKLRFETLDQLIRVLAKSAKLDEARATARQARAVIARLGFRPRFEAGIRQRESQIEWAANDYARALALREEALGWAERVTPPDELMVGQMRLNLGNALQRMHRFDEAEKQLALGRVALEHALGPDHPQLGGIYTSEGGLFYMRSDYQRAAAAFERAIAHFDRTLGPNNVESLVPLNDLGTVYLEQDRFVDAVRIFERGAAFEERRLGRDHPSVASWLISLGTAHFDLGDIPHALAAGQHAMAILERYGKAPVELARARFLVGQAVWKSRTDPARAKQLIAQARASYVAAGDAGTDAIKVIDTWVVANRVK